MSPLVFRAIGTLLLTWPELFYPQVCSLVTDNIGGGWFQELVGDNEGDWNISWKYAEKKFPKHQYNNRIRTVDFLTDCKFVRLPLPWKFSYLTLSPRCLHQHLFALATLCQRKQQLLTVPAPNLTTLQSFGRILKNTNKNAASVALVPCRLLCNSHRGSPYPLQPAQHTPQHRRGNGKNAVFAPHTRKKN